MKHTISAVFSGIAACSALAACSADTAPSSERLFSNPTDSSGTRQAIVTPVNAVTRPGDSVQFVMTPKASSVSWSVSDTSVAKIAQTGWAFARRVGEVTVTAAATSGDKVAASLRVSAAP